MNLTTKDVARYWTKVDVFGEDGCWVWRGQRCKDGYGRFWLSGKNVLATHVALFLVGKFVPKRFCALHECDNPSCVNPNHLYIGNHQQNANDRKKRGRQAVGAIFKRSTLTDADVLEIRRIYHPATSTYKELATRFGTSSINIKMIVQGRTWKHLGEVRYPFPKVRRIGEKSKRNKVTDEQVRQIRQLIADGVKCTEIAKRLRIGLSIIYNISAGRAWAHVH